MSEESPEGAAAPLDFIDGAGLLLVGFGKGDAGEAFADRLVATPGLSAIQLQAVQQVETLAAADEILRAAPVGVLVLGPGVTGRDEVNALLSFLEGFKTRHPFQGTVHLTVGLGEKGAIQRLVQADALFFAVSPRDGSDALSEGGIDSLGELVGQAFEHFRRSQIFGMAAEAGIQDRRAVIARQLTSVSETLLQTADLESAGDPILETLRDLLGVEWAKLWLYDSVAHTLSDAGAGGVEMSAVTGLTALAARSAGPVVASTIEKDARTDPEVDGERGHLLAVPVIGAEDQVLSVLAMGRMGEPFSAPDLEVAERLASHLGPPMARFAPRALESALQSATLGDDADLFRREALEAQARGFSERGRILHNTRGWTEWTWWLLLSGFAAALLFTVIGRVHDYAAGPAVVRIGERVDVTAPTGAPVTSVEVSRQQPVSAGEPLVRLFGAPQASLIANLEEEFEQRLRQRLADPGDPVAEASLVDVRTRLEDAKARLDERTVRAPVGGIVGDVRVRPGQHPAAGEVLMSIIADVDQRKVIGLLPGHFRPQLEGGQRIRLTLQGYPDLALKLLVDSVGEEVIAAAEARASLGRTVAAPIENIGSVVVVEASLEEASFSDGRQRLDFSDGMQGSMEIRVRSRPLLFHLIPGLDTALRGFDEDGLDDGGLDQGSLDQGSLDDGGLDESDSEDQESGEMGSGEGTP